MLRNLTISRFRFLAVWLILALDLSVQAVPFALEKAAENSYQDDKEFKKEVSDKLDNLVKNEGVVFDRILLVNDIHKRWKDKYQKTKRNGKYIPDIIIDNNLKKDNLLFEGDMKLNKIDQEMIHGGTNETRSRRKRNAVYARKKIWTSRQVPYVLDGSLSPLAKQVIQQAMAVIHSKTCIRWVKYHPLYHDNYVLFTKDNGCFSAIGKQYYTTGAQKLSIGEGCEWVGTALHEMTHAMGFFHEQSRDDRDRHIEIIWENIPKTFQDQFEKYSHGTIDKLGKNYDFNSIMHYSSTAFGGGKTTIRPIDPTKRIGGSETYTALDVEEINALYDCGTSEKFQAHSNWSPWSECDQHCYKERQQFCFHKSRSRCPNSNVYGIQTQRVKCSTSECPAPINGNWGNWAAWSACSKTCDEGQRQRSRKCNRPVPAANGKFCVGESTDFSACVVRRCKIGPYDVDFDNGDWGMWFSDNTAEILWTILSGPVKTLGTGPLGDHTLKGLGNYIYVESSKRVKNNKARLVSKKLEFLTPQCLSFYYIMHGANMGSLKLWLAPVAGGQWLEKFSKTGNQGTAWHAADVTLDYKGQFQLIFQASLGGTGTSDIALDDIFIDNKACPSSHSNPLPAECKDLHASCSDWAQTKQCEDNPGYMHKYCKASCGLCPKACEDSDYLKCGELARKGECKTNKDVAKKCKESCGLCPGKPCKDDDLYHERCKKWANVQGECFKTQKFMFKYCKASCGICSACIDDQIQCINWTAKGECKKNPGFMALHCKASCGLCGDCEDTYQEPAKCSAWANSGLCKKNPSTMLLQCKKSCTSCHAICYDTNTLCPDWASKSECTKNPTWMSENCKKSCGKC